MCRFYFVQAKCHELEQGSANAHSHVNSAALDGRQQLAVVIREEESCHGEAERQ
jgi:hypothetical protein